MPLLSGRCLQKDVEYYNDTDKHWIMDKVGQVQMPKEAMQLQPEGG
jgi:hypothetical protein